MPIAKPWPVACVILVVAAILYACSKPSNLGRHVAPCDSIMADTGSMEPFFHGGDQIRVIPINIEDVEVDDVIDTWWEGSRLNVGHRVIGKIEVNGQIVLITKGDANPVRDAHVTTKENLNGLILKK